MVTRSYARKRRLFWQTFSRLGYVILTVGTLLVLFGVDIARQHETTEGRVIADVASGAPRGGVYSGQSVNVSRQLLEFTVDGETHTIRYARGTVGETVALRYYRRWPSIAWVGSRLTWPVYFGSFLIIVAGGIALGKRIWGRD